MKRAALLIVVLLGACDDAEDKGRAAFLQFFGRSDIHCIQFPGSSGASADGEACSDGKRITICNKVGDCLVVGFEPEVAP